MGKDPSQQPRLLSPAWHRELCVSICLSVEAAPGKPLAMPLGVVCLQHPPLRTLLAKKSGKEKKKKSNKGGKAPLVLFQAWQEGPTTALQPPAISRSCFNYPPCKPHFVSGSPSRHFLVVTLLAAEGAAANTSFYLEYMRTKDKWK